MIEGEDLIAQHRQPVEVLRSLVVLDRRHRGLQVSDVRFESNRHAIAKTPLHSLRQQRQVPRSRDRHSQTDAGSDHLPTMMVQRTIDHELQPQR